MKKCLVIDNKPMMRKVASTQLELLGISVREVETAEQALEICRKRMPDLIFVDWKMPGMDGIAFIAALKDEVKRKKPKVVMLSVNSDPAEINEALEAGADAYLTKPVSLIDLKNALTEAGIQTNDKTPK